jgi:hypothetical protein
VRPRRGWLGVDCFVLPIDEATVYNEILELLYIERNDLKKLDSAAKLDAITDKALDFSADFEEITYQEGLRRMGPAGLPERLDAQQSNLLIAALHQHAVDGQARALRDADRTVVIGVARRIHRQLRLLGFIDGQCQSARHVCGVGSDV